MKQVRTVDQMTSQNSKAGECVLSEISAYIDGELPPADELAFETHISACSACRRELNDQKLFFSAVDASMHQNAAIDIPTDFSRKVTAAAESKVSGFRDPNERKVAAWICAALAVITLLLAGADALGIFTGFADRASAIAQFAFNIFTSAAVVVAVLLRSVAAVAFSPRQEFLIAAAFAVALIYAGSKMLPRYLRGSR